MYIQGLLTLTSDSRVNQAALFPVVISFWSATITLNLYSTTMIILRIRCVIREFTATQTSTVSSCPSQPQSTLQNAMRIVIESGLLYTLTSIFVLITPIKGSDPIFITTAAEVQVIGIAFNLILIRVKRVADPTVGGREHTEMMSFASPTAFAAHETRTSTMNAKAIAFEYVDVESRGTEDHAEKKRSNV